MDTTFLCKRLWFTDKSTISELFLKDSFQCNILEDRVRDIKVPGETAIPYGTYEVVVSFSNRFNMFLPLLLNVPNYEGVRIHPGNKAQDTEGCLLPGTYDPKNPDFVSSSRSAFNLVFPKIKEASEFGKVYWKIIDGRAI